MTTFKKILNILKYTLFALATAVLLFNVALIVKRSVSGDEMPDVFGLSTALVTTGSMTGTIDAGDMVIVAAQNDYQVGDVITFRSGNNYVTHRIVSVSSNGFTTQGDANNATDQAVGEGLVTTDAIKGKVVLTIRNVGNFANFLRSPSGIAALVLVLAAILFVPTLFGKKEKSFN